MRALAALLLAMGLAAGCGERPAAPTTLRVTAIPDQRPENVRAQHVPLLDVACPAAGVRCEWVAIPTYDGVVEALARGQVDLAYLGGATFAAAQARSDAVPLVIRDVDTRFSSTLVVRSDAPARKLEDLRGTSLLFGNHASTSGHVMARYYLVRSGVQPESFFASVAYAPNHDATLAAVAAGQAHAGVVNSAIALRALGSGGRYAGRLRVLWESPAYLDYVWTARGQLDPALRQRLVDAFLDLDRTVPAQAAVLRAQGAGGFLPASREEYGRVAEALRAVPP